MSSATRQIQRILPLTKYRYWAEIRDGDPAALQIYSRHYTLRKYRDGRQRDRFVGPGYRIVLITPDQDALFVWRKFIPFDNQEGVNCSVFRNESRHLASSMILEAERFAIDRWGSIRAYTYINPRKIKSSNPGYCFKCAGWHKEGLTTKKLIIMAKELRNGQMG